MVAHQNIAVNNPPRLAACLPQRLQEHLAICIVLKDRPTPITTTHHMVDRTRILNSWLPRHRQHYHRMHINVSMLNTIIRGQPRSGVLYMQQLQVHHGGPGAVFALICIDLGRKITSWLKNQIS